MKQLKCKFLKIPLLVSMCFFLTLLSTINVQAATDYTYTNQNGHAFTASSSVHQTTDNTQTTKWVLTLKDGTTREYLDSGTMSSYYEAGKYTTHTCVSGCTTSYTETYYDGTKCGGKLVNNRCSKCGKSGLGNTTCNYQVQKTRTVTTYTGTHYVNNSGWQDPYYDCAYAGATTIEPFYGMNGATLQYFIGSTPQGTVYTLNVPDSLFIPEITSKLTIVFSNKKAPCFQGANYKDYL